jgi:hypothetical protein
MACDPALLLEQAKCIITCIPSGMIPAVNTALLCQILANGGGGGGGVNQVYIDRAPAAPNNPALPALSYPTGGGPLQQWDVATAAWV